MSKEFKVGDRVSVYEIHRNWETSPNLFSLRKTGEIIETDPIGKVHIKLDHISGVTVWFHQKQCRRLVPKKRKELWIRPQPFGPATLWHVCEPHDLGATLFREVVRKPK